jgi:hypothetical protein
MLIFCNANFFNKNMPDKFIFQYNILICGILIFVTFGS